VLALLHPGAGAATTDGSASALPAVQPAQMSQICQGLVCAASCQSLGVAVTAPQVI